MVLSSPEAFIQLDGVTHYDAGKIVKEIINYMRRNGLRKREKKRIGKSILVIGSRLHRTQPFKHAHFIGSVSKCDHSNSKYYHIPSPIDLFYSCHSCLVFNYPASTLEEKYATFYHVLKSAMPHSAGEW